MSCGRDAKKCKDEASRHGAPEAEAAWAEGRTGGGHCPNCGGFLRKDGGCTSCEKRSPTIGASEAGPPSSRFGHCTQCGAGLSVGAGEEDWCLECEELVTAEEPDDAAGSPAIEDYARAARELQDAAPSPERNAIQVRLKSIGYERVKLALKSVGVPDDGEGAKAAAISNMVWQYLDRCPHCKAWISPKSGVCNNPRCKKQGTKVGEVRGWPPVRVSWVTNKARVGQVLDGKAPAPVAVKTEAVKSASGEFEISLKKEADGWYSQRTGADYISLFSGPHASKEAARQHQLRQDYLAKIDKRAKAVYGKTRADFLLPDADETDPDYAPLDHLIADGTPPAKFLEKVASALDLRLYTPTGIAITPEHIEAYRREARRFLKRYPGADPEELFQGDQDVIIRELLQSGETPEDYIAWYADKYDLTPIDDGLPYSSGKPAGIPAAAGVLPGGKAKLSKDSPYTPVRFDKPPTSDELDNVLRRVFADAPKGAARQITVEFDRPVRVYRMSGKKPRRKFSLSFFRNTAGGMSYSFRKRGAVATGWSASNLLGPAVSGGGRLVGLKPVSPEGAGIEKRAELSKLATLIHPNVWPGLRRRLTEEPEGFLGTNTSRVSIKRAFGREGEWVAKQLEDAFENGKNFTHTQYGKKRDKRVTVEVQQDGSLKAWFSSEYAGTGNGDYYYLLNPRTASLGERD